VIEILGRYIDTFMKFDRYDFCNTHICYKIFYLYFELCLSYFFYIKIMWSLHFIILVLSPKDKFLALSLLTNWLNDHETHVLPITLDHP
jgi:hypothetical protein